jgi:hypothetical protein
MKEMNKVFFLAIDETSGMFTCYENIKQSGEFILEAKDYGSNLFFK